MAFTELYLQWKLCIFLEKTSLHILFWQNSGLFFGQMGFIALCFVRHVETMCRDVHGLFFFKA